jgi:mono/diheme cytochrome c family protein
MTLLRVGAFFRVSVFVAVAGLLPAAGPVASAAQTAPADEASSRAVLDKYCVGCHNARQKTGGLVLEATAANVGAVTSQSELWEKVIRKLRTQSMPPAGARRPDAATLDALAGWLEATLDRAAAASPNPGRPQVHRLNRAEYSNAVRDLLALDIDGRALLPADNVGYGFDNIADVLTVSPGLLERYLLAARKISRLAVGDPTIRPVAQTYKVSFTRVQNERMGEELPFGSRGGASIQHTFPVNGEYALKIRLQIPAMGGGVRGEAIPNTIDVRLDGERVRLFSLPPRTRGSQPYGPSTDLMEGLDLRFAAKAGPHALTVTFQKTNWASEGIGPSHMPATSYAYAHASNTDVGFGRIDMSIDAVDVIGPFTPAPPELTPSRQRIFICQPVSQAQEVACALRIISTMAQRAYRRAVTPAEIETILNFYRQGRAQGDFDTGIQRALERILVSPDFLFRGEREPSPKTRAAFRISDVELASRLSFFLWSSIPDDELLGLAIKGRLSQPAVLEQQVRRLIADPRSSALIENFFGQWLWLRNVRASTPDPKVYQEFDDNLREAFQRETQLFLESQVRDDRPVTDLLTANYTFVNERLAQHYGIPNVYGSHFRKVTHADPRRAGLLGQGGPLMVTSYAHRTSPVVRGKWLLENLLGTPPPPPPPNVPPFPENEGVAQPRSVRERMEQHRRNPVCATCHSQLDPLGFALENFDGVGQWRTIDGTTPIDASGQFPNGTKFNGPAEFRAVLLQNREAFLTTAASKLLTYALGRGVEHADMPAVRKILRDSSAGDYRWSSLILSIVRSAPFQMRSPRPS